MGTSASRQGSKAADIYTGETCSCKQISGLTLYRLLCMARKTRFYGWWELSIFLDIKVCGFNSACIYNTVIASWSDICDIEIWATSILRLKKRPNLNYLLSLIVVRMW